MGTAAIHTNVKRTVLGEDANLTGRVVGEDITLLGRFEGDIEASGTVHAAERSRVKARLVAREVTVAGEFEGEVQAERLCFGPLARARGRFAADCLTIADGANVDGAFNLAAVAEPPSLADARPSAQLADVEDASNRESEVVEAAPIAD